MHRPLCLALCGVAVAGAVAPASAQLSWESRLRYRIQGNDSIAPGAVLPLITPGTYTVVVQIGVFNLTGLAPGESNHGLYAWTTRINSTGLNTAAGETLGVNPSTARIAPFNWQGTALAGYVAEGGTAIYGSAMSSNMFSPCRSLFGGTASANWACDQSFPAGPADWSSSGAPIGYSDRGADSYIDIYRFSVRLTPGAGPDVVLIPTGTTQPIRNWGVLSSSDCDSEVDFVGLATQTPATLPVPPQPLTITRCPLNLTMPANLTLVPGQSAVLAVTAMTPLAVTSYQWRHSGVPLADDGHISGSNTATLTINPTSLADAGVYNVLVTVPCGTRASFGGVINFFCPADWNHDFHIQADDVAAFINDWLTSLDQGILSADFDHNGVVDPSDVAAFMNAWMSAVGHPC